MSNQNQQTNNDGGTKQGAQRPETQQVRNIEQKPAAPSNSGK